MRSRWFGPAILLAWALAASAQESLFEFTPAPAAESRIEIWPATRAARPVSRLLYGKFTEHLWWNVYNGLWAQVLKNSSFEPVTLIAGDERRIPDWVRRNGVPADFPQLKIGDTPHPGVAPWWAPWGEAAVRYELDPQGFNAQACQKIDAESVSGGAGIEQAIFLPLHRELRYTLEFHARGAAPLRVTVLSKEKPLATAEVPVDSREWRRYTAALRVTRPQPARGVPLLFRIELTRPGAVWLDQAFLIPDDHAEGFDPDVLRMLRESRLPLLRFPGGNFVSGYHWEDGVGPIHQRPVRRNPAWGGFEPNHLGTDEYLALCRLIGCEPLICVNAGNGTAREAANWVAYCNGPPDSKYGALRARNGHRAPYNVRYWEIGNELYGKWQIGHCTPEEYAQRFGEFHRAMTAADPSLRFLAIGQSREWSAPVVKQHPSIAGTLAVHELPGGNVKPGAPPVRVFEELMAWPFAVRAKLHGLADLMREAGATPRFAITEAQLFTGGRGLPSNATLSEALFLAGLIHMAIREGGQVEMITHSALVNHGGGLRKQKEFVFATPVHYASVLYGTQPGEFPVRIRTAAPEFVSPGQYLGATKGERAPVLDAVALASPSGNEVSLMVLNRSPDQAIGVAITLHGFRPQGPVNTRTLTASSYLAQNTFESPENVVLAPGSAEPSAETLRHRFPPHSLVEIIFRRARE